MTEIQWLVDMMLHEKLSASARTKFLARIGEVESKLSVAPQPPKPFGMQTPGFSQAPQVPHDQIAQSPIAAQALAMREQAINQGLSGKAEPGRTSPRKF